MSKTSGRGGVWGRQNPKAKQLNYTQAAAVQNTWYTALKANDISISSLVIGCTVADETLQLRITVNDVVYISAGVAITATQWTTITTVTVHTAPPTLVMSASAASITLAASLPFTEWFKGHNVTVDARKTTATGASALRVICVYSES